MTLARLSVLDQSVAVDGQEQGAAIRETLALAEYCEALGYHRYWLSEHHSSPTIVGTAPEVLMAAIAARTQRIRIGSAGVMLPHYAPLKVAEQFRVLEALAPGRIDLGVGRAPGSDWRTAQLLNSNTNAAEEFPQAVQQLAAWIGEGAGAPGFPRNHPAYGIHAHPTGPTTPALWMLGSSDYGAQLAAHLGMPYAFAYFITDGQGAAEALSLYRERFKPSETLGAPHATLCVWALVADTDEEAWHLFKSRERARIERNHGRYGPLLPPERAERAYDSAEMLHRDKLRRNALVGAAPAVATRLRALAEAHAVDELVVITWAYDAAARRKSYALLAREFSLAPR